MKNIMMETAQVTCGLWEDLCIHKETWWWNEEVAEAVREKKKSLEISKKKTLRHLCYASAYLWNQLSVSLCQCCLCTYNLFLHLSHYLSLLTHNAHHLLIFSLPISSLSLPSHSFSVFPFPPLLSFCSFLSAPAFPFFRFPSCSPSFLSLPFSLLTFHTYQNCVIPVSSLSSFSPFPPFPFLSYFPSLKCLGWVWPFCQFCSGLVMFWCSYYWYNVFYGILFVVSDVWCLSAVMWIKCLCLGSDKNCSWGAVGKIAIFIYIGINKYDMLMMLVTALRRTLASSLDTNALVAVSKRV